MLSSINVFASDLSSYIEGTTKNNANKDDDKINVEKLSLDINNRYLDYVLDSYDINIVVNEDNTLNIREKIVAYFFVSKHVILRSIPLSNKVVRLDGTTSNNRARISNISVDAPFKTSISSGNKEIKIGD